ncbi:MAG: hypothetical protein V4450_14070 [Bacteroidota bacterium]
MKQLTLFRILSFVLLPIAAMFGFIDFILLLSALANPPLLLMVFLIAAFVIYTFSSLKFLSKGIDTGRPCKPSLRDWIRANAFVSVFMGVMFLLNAVSILFMSDVSLRQFIAQFRETQPNIPAMLTPELFLTILKMMAYFMLFVGAILLTHIFLNFRMLKQYGFLFDAPKSE